MDTSRAVAARAPIEDPEELVRLLASLMQDAADAIAVERAIGGAVRLCGLPLSSRAALAAGILRHARRRASDGDSTWFTGYAVTEDMALLTLAWGTGALPSPRWGYMESRSVTRLLGNRIREACELIVAGSAGQLLAEPEAADGAISHQSLLDRLTRRAWPAPGEYDLEQSLLRLAPGAPGSFWADWDRCGVMTAARARRLHEESLAAVDFEIVADGPLKPSVLARPVTPARDLGSRFWTMLTDLPATSTDHYIRSLRRLGGVEVDAFAAALPLLCPNNPELVAAHLLMQISDSLSQIIDGEDHGVQGAHAALARLAAPGRMLGQVGHLAMMTGLASDLPGMRYQAAKVWARASRDGRLSPDLAARAIVEGVAAYAFRPSRLADGLGQAAKDAVSGQAVAEAAIAATATLLRTMPAPPGNLYLILEVAAQVSAFTELASLPAEITALAARKSTTRLAKAARQLTGAARSPAARAVDGTHGRSCRE